ncbi:YjbE family putative metal transport protein [uncultured Aquitalea sp.]|uniref:YjbE family putative metal transport protein n=1 Tax=uncultured Aquitalea sp. TaxID=540272 RepID=UPI0025D8AB60|nr:YjbE family putative metal transport protein [uncultured Aquitalea sp.]
MEMDSLMHMLGLTLQVFFLDLILSGDNALVIAMACRSLPRHLMGKAVMLGTGFAILLRVLLTVVVGFLLQVPLLKLVGALLLISIAIKLLLGEDDDGDGRQFSDSRHLWSAVSVIVMADLVLSLDNVVALAAAAQGSVLFLVLGLLLSVPLLMYGSLFISRILGDYPLLVPAGAGLLGWVAGQLAVSDPLIADWVNTQSPALQVVVPALCVVYVLAQARIIRDKSPGLEAPPPLGLFDGLGRKLAQMGEAASPQPAAAQATASDAAMAKPSEPVAFAELAGGNAPAMLPSADAPELPLATPLAAVEAEPQIRPAERPARASRDGMLNSPRLALLVKVMLAIAVVVGVCALGWLVFHLLSQGILPHPKHPNARNH